MTPPIWYRLMRRLKTSGGFAPSMQSLMMDAGVDLCHGRHILKHLEKKKLIALGPGDQWCRPVQMLETDTDKWISSIYGGNND